MPQINCYIPIKLCITGRLSDAQLEELSDTIVSTLKKRMAFAERMITNSSGRDQSGRTEIAREGFEASRFNVTEGDYQVPSYQNRGERCKVAVREPAMGSPEWLRQFRGGAPQLAGGAAIASQGVALKKSVEITHWASERELQQFITEYIEFTKGQPQWKKNYEEAVAAREGLLQAYRDSQERRAQAKTQHKFSTLKYDERIRLLRDTADSWLVGEEKEQTLNDLIDSTPEPDAARLVRELRANNSELLRRLEKVIDGEEYVRFHKVLKRLYLRSAAPEEMLDRRTRARATALLWSDPPGLIAGLKEGRTHYKVTQNQDGTIHVERWRWMKDLSVDFEPFEMVSVYFKTGEDLLGGEKGRTVEMPAVNLLLLENKQSQQELQLVANVLMMVGGGAGIVRAAGWAGRAFAAAEAAIGAANTAVNDYKSELTKTPAGKAFLSALDAANFVFVLYGAGTAVRSLYRVAPKILGYLRTTYKALQAARANMNPSVAAKVDAEMVPVLSSADDVEKVIATEAPGDVSTTVGELGKPAPPKTPVVATPSKPSEKPMPAPKSPTEALTEPKPTVKAPSASPQAEAAPSGQEGATRPPQDLNDLRQSARIDPDAAHALRNRYKQMSDFEVFQRFAEGADETAAAEIRRRFPSNYDTLRKILLSEYRPPHSADAILRRPGQSPVRQRFQSGGVKDLPPEIRARGWRAANSATHTEAKAVREMKLRKGDFLEIVGQYNPCPACQRAMKEAATANGATISYWWPGGSEVFSP